MYSGFKITFLKFNRFQSIAHQILNLLFILYASLLPFSDAFSTHTGPWLLLLFWLLEGDFAKKFCMIFKQRAIVLWLLFFGYSTLSLLWTTNIGDGIHIIRYYFAITIVVITIYTSLDRKFRPWLIYFFLIAMFISELSSYGIYFNWWQIKNSSPQNPTPFMHHVIYSIFLAVTIALLLGQIFNYKNHRWLKILELLFLLSVTGNIFINGGRTGQIAMIFGVITFALVKYGIKFKTLAITIIILTGVFSTAYILSPNFQNRIAQGISDINNIRQGRLDNSWGYRVAMIELSLKNISKNPLIGNGIGDVKKAFKETLLKTPLKRYRFLQNILHVHNQFLQIAMQNGIIGLVLFLLFLISLINSAKSLEHTQKAVFYAIVTVFIFSFFTDVPLRSYTSGLFGLILGYFLYLSYTKIEACDKITTIKKF